MSVLDLIIPVTHVFQIVVGILGNVSLMIHYICLYVCGCRARSTDLILRHLTVANFLVIISKGIPQTMAAFGWKDFLNDFECKLVLYIHRVARGVSIGSTCLLSVFQAITINPRNSRWAHIKQKALKYIGPSNIFTWTLQILVNASFHMSGQKSNITITKKNHLGYCSFPANDSSTFGLFAALISSHDVMCLGLMIWASSFMIFILYRHKERVKHIYRNKLSHRSSPETRASHTILLLVSTFVFFYALSSVMYAYLAFFYNPSWLLVDMSALITACFPTVSPFILMNSDPRVLRFSCVCWGWNVKFPSRLRKNITHIFCTIWSR